MSDENKKRYVLDTNVLVHDPDCLYKFHEHDVYIPSACIREMDRFKKEPSERGAGAREAGRRLEKLRVKAKEEGSSLNKGVDIGEGSTGKLYVFSEKIGSELGLSLDGPEGVDNLCLEITNKLSEGGHEAILVTKDINLRIIADGYDVPCEDYKYDKKGHTLEHIFKKNSISEIYMPGDIIDSIYDRKPGEQIDLIDSRKEIEQLQPFMNQGIVLKSFSNDKQTVLVRYESGTTVRRLVYGRSMSVASIKARNLEQTLAFDALLDPSIKVVSILSKAGTGKTLLSLAAGVQQILHQERYRKMIVVRPTTVMGGKDLGYLPGSLEEKESPFMDAIHDNLAVIFDYGKVEDRWDEESYMEEIRAGHIDLRTPTYLRGRSLPRVFIVVDEAQNLTPHIVKSLATRLGEKSKIVFVGDPWQIDDPYLDEESNGLTQLVKMVIGKRRYFSAEFLKKGERNPEIDIADIL